MSSTQKKYPWEKRRRKLLWFVLFLFVLPVLAGYAIHWHNAWRFQKQLAAIRVTGYPATPQELAQWSAQPPSAQAPVQSPAVTSSGPTAVDGYQEVFGLFERAYKSPAGKEISDKLATLMKDAPKQGRFSDEIHDLMERNLVENAEALHKLHEMPKRPPGRFPLDFTKGMNIEIPHLAKVRQAGRLLQMEAWVSAENGDADRAFEALLACMAVDAPVRSEPILISQLVSIACHGIACDTLRRVLGVVSFSDAQLDRLGKALPKLEDKEAFCRALAGERVLMLESYSHPDLSEDETIKGLNEFFPGASTLAAPVAGALVFSASDRSRFLSVMNEMIEAARKPTHEAIPAMEAIKRKTEVRSWVPRASNFLLPSLPGAIDAFARDQAQLRSACAALAVERYRLVANRVPNSLDALVPAFLSAVPQDPFDGKPLRYLPQGAGYVVYSVGSNLKDDQGAELSAKGDRFKTSDWTFRVKH